MKIVFLTTTLLLLLVGSAVARYCTQTCYCVAWRNGWCVQTQCDTYCY